MSQVKTVAIFSVGRRWPDAYPKAPDKEVLQYIVDVRSAIPDPGEVFPGQDGTTDTVQDWILEQPGVEAWLVETYMMVRKWVRAMEESAEFDQVSVVFMCEGGFQRSVFVAEQIAKRLMLYTMCSAATHLTMERTRIAKQAATTPTT